MLKYTPNIPIELPNDFSPARPLAPPCSAPAIPATCIHQLEQGIMRAVSQGKLAFEHIAWISVSQNCMAKSSDEVSGCAVTKGASFCVGKGNPRAKKPLKI